MSLNVEILCDYTSIIISAFLGLHFIFLPHGNKRANLLLGIFLLLTSTSVAHALLFDYFEPSNWFALFSVFINSIFISAPILLYYSFALTNTFDQNKKKYLWTFFPVVIEITLFLTHLITNEFLGLNITSIHYVIDLYLFLSFPFSIYIYILILKEIKTHNNNILNLFSSIENKQLNWLRLIVMINIGFIFFWLIDDSLNVLIGDNLLSHAIAILSMYATLINVLWMGFASLRQPTIYGQEFNITSDQVNDSVLNTKEESVQTDKELLLFEKIKLQIEKELIFTDSNLSLKSLAEFTQVRDKELSRLINTYYGNNFYHFINTLRIDYFKKLYLSDDTKNLSILGIAEESGFKSKSTFYSAFKKLEGMTPKAFELNNK